MAKAKSKKITIEDALVAVDEQPYEVPENWCWTKLGALINLHRGVSYKKNDAHDVKEDGDCLILRGGNIGEGYIDVEVDNVYVSKELVEDHQLVRENDIVIVGSTGSTKVIGRAGISLQDYNDVAFGAFLMLARPIGEVNAKYIGHLFQSDIYRNRIRTLASGVNINNIKADYINETAVPLPPLPEQQRIVEQIEKVFSKLDEVEEITKTSIEMLKTQYEGIIQSACDGELSLSWRVDNNISTESWEMGVIGDYISELSQGWSPKCKNTPSTNADTWGVIKTTAIQRMYFDESENKELPSDLEPRTKHEIRPGDILVTRAGPRIRVGICCLVKTIRKQLLLCDKAYRFQTKKEKMIPEFFVLFMNSSKMMDTINKMKTGISDSGLNLTQDGFKRIEMRCPSIEEQIFIVDECSSMLEKNVNMQRNAEEILEKIDSMKKSILAKAFHGELGTNDPSEESLIEQLKHIIES